MLDSTLLDRLKCLTDVAFTERRNQVPMEVMQINGEANKRGVFHSSMRLQQIHAVYAREVAIRAQLVWQSIVRVHQTLGSQVTDSFRSDLKDAIKDYATSIHRELSGLLEETYRGSSIQMGKATLDDARDLAIAKHLVEVDIYVDSLLTTQNSSGATSLSGTYNFYAPVGAVQTGTGAVANVVQTLCNEDRASLRAALAQVKVALDASSSIPEVQRAELVGIAAECGREVDAGNPNSTKLMALLTVQFRLSRMLDQPTKHLKWLFCRLGLISRDVWPNNSTLEKDVPQASRLSMSTLRAFREHVDAKAHSQH